MEAQIIRLLKQHGALHVGAIAELSEAHPYQVDQCCTRLFRQGYLTTETCGVYRLTPSGHRYRESGESTTPAD